MKDYVVAWRRNQPKAEAGDLARQLRAVPGVTDVKLGPYGRVVISASSNAIAAVKEQLGAFCVIEPIIVHNPSKKPHE